MLPTLPRIDLYESELIRVWMWFPCEDFPDDDFIIIDEIIYPLHFSSIGRACVRECFECFRSIPWNFRPVSCPIERDFHRSILGSFRKNLDFCRSNIHLVRITTASIESYFCERPLARDTTRTIYWTIYEGLIWTICEDSELGEFLVV